MATIVHPPVCKFTKNCKTLDTIFPPHLKFSRLRRKIRECMLVSEENGRRCFTPQGSAGYFFEKEKQLSQAYYKIHPYSKFRQWWEMIAVCEIVLTLFIRTFVAAYSRTDIFPLLAYHIPSFLADLFEMSDVFLCFITGYIEVGTRNVALETRKIFYHNISQFYLYLNFVCSFPNEFTVYLYSLYSGQQIRCVYCIFLKIFKLVTITKYLHHMAKIYNWSDLVVKVVWTFLTMFIVIHWLSCLFYLVVYGSDFGEPQNKFHPTDTEFSRYCCIFYIISSIYFFQHGLLTNLDIVNIKDLLFCVFVLLFSHLSNIVFVGLFIQLLGLRKTALVQYEKMIQEVQKFLIQENLPQHVHKKVMSYYEFRFRRKFFNEKVILDTLSPPLRREIANFLCMDLILNPKSIFRGISRELASDLCLEMKLEVFMTGDHIIKAGSRAKKIYFIYCGSAAVYTSRGKELLHVFEGDQVGVSAFSMNNRYLMTVIALEITECYVLSYKDYLKFAAQNPDYMTEITHLVNQIRFLHKSTHLD